jgi:hypothetical protein
MTLHLSTMTWAALALVVPPELRSRIVAALRISAPGERRIMPIQLSAAEAHLVAQRLRRMC